MIIGSANINDRSMLGDRDSEIAIRIEDKEIEAIQFSDYRFVVGKTAHELRVRLMRQHLGDKTANVSNILSRDIFLENWESVAMHNSTIYDMLDGEMSVYRCKKISHFQADYRDHVNKSIKDVEVQAAVKSIRGFLVNWPLTFLEEENLAPSLATKALIPNDLWV